MRLATFNVENLFARAKALTPKTRAEGAPALAAFERFNRIAAESDLFRGRQLRSAGRARDAAGAGPTADGRRPNPRPSTTAGRVLRENRGDLLVAPPDAEPRIVANGRGDWIGWVELLTEPVDEVGIMMTAKVITDLAADVLCVVEAEDRPSLVRFNDELLDGRYGHGMLVDGNDLRGIDVGLFCTGGGRRAVGAQPRRRPGPSGARQAPFQP